MTFTKILIEELRDELLFPKLFPFRSSTTFTSIYLDHLKKRLYNKKPKYPYPIRYIPSLEHLPFCEDIVKSVQGGEEEKNAAVVKKVLEIFRHDRSIITQLMRIFNYGVGSNRSSSIFSRLSLRYLSPALQELSKEKGDGKYIVTVFEIPDLKSEEGISLVIRRIAYQYGAQKKISGLEALIESFMAEDLTLPSPEGDEGGTLEQEKQELAQQVEKLKDTQGLEQ